MWILAEGLIDIFVAHLAGFGTHVSSGSRWLGFRSGRLGRQSRKENEKNDRSDCQRSRGSCP
jgi:hypothetical protein